MIARTLEEIEGLIRAGKVAGAGVLLKALPFARLSRSEKLSVAGLARRAGLPELTVRFLNPLIRSQKAMERPSIEERALYAAGLSEIGATNEALDILRAIQDRPLPSIALYQVSALFSQWRYREAIGCLERYLSFGDLAPYQRLIGLVNLSAAYIFEREDARAASALAKARAAARELDAKRLYGNCMELEGQLAIFRGDFSLARQALAEAEESLRGSGALDELYVRKWKSILDLRRLQGSPARQREPLAALLAVRREAGKRGDLESVRDCDFHRAIAMRDSKLFTHVYRGTPFSDYRHRMELEAWKGLETAEGEFVWKLGAGQGRAHVLDLSLGLGQRSNVKIRAGSLPHRLLEVFCRDFYGSWRPAALFAELFPGEYFHPVTSPDRVHKILRRLRAWFVTHELPLRVVEKRGHYALTASAQYSIRLPAATTTLTREQVLLSRLQKDPPAAPFSSAEAARKLGISERSAVRLLGWAVGSRALRKLGARAGARYLWTPGG